MLVTVFTFAMSLCLAVRSGVVRRSDPNRNWLKLPEAAKYLGASQRQMYRWVQGKRIAYTRLGNQLLFSLEQLDEFVARHTFTPAGADTVRRHSKGEVAMYLGVTVAEVSAWVEQGLLLPDDPTGATLFSLESLGNFQRENSDLV